MALDDAAQNTNVQVIASPSITLVLCLTLLLFIFTGFFSIFFCRCLLDSINGSRHHRHGQQGSSVGGVGVQGRNVKPGLDPSIIKSFPQFVYSTVKHFRKGGNHGLECAICLSEFDDDDSLRLLTFCCHVFHQECIDQWLESHKTCPVCRKNLNDNPDDYLLQCPILQNDSRHSTINANEENPLKARPLSEFVSIDITSDDDVADSELKGRKGNENGKEPTSFYASENLKLKNNEDGIFPKSHSTGHSSLGIKGSIADKHTLILREDVHSRLTRHQCSRSCTDIQGFANSTNPAKVVVAKTTNRGDGNEV